MDSFNETNTSRDGNMTEEVTPLGNPTLITITDVLLVVVIVIVTLGSGCATEIKELVNHLRRPVGPGIGFTSQFIVFPLVTFGFAHALRLDPLVAVGMILMGCSPGGPISNMFTYWVDGDVSLSLTMTSLSSILALGMMPLNVWLYSRSWTSVDLVIPYTRIVISLLMVVVPATVGVVIRWKRENLAKRLVKIGSVCGGLLIVVTITLMSIIYPFMYNAPWTVYIGALVLPILGMLFGYVLAVPCRMGGKRARTVAFEVGIQNFPLCMTIITVSFPSTPQEGRS